MRNIVSVVALTLLGCAQAPPPVDVEQTPPSDAGANHPTSMAPPVTGSFAPQVDAMPTVMEPSPQAAGSDDATASPPPPDDAGRVVAPPPPAEASAPVAPPPPSGATCVMGQQAEYTCHYPAYADASDLCQVAYACMIGSYTFPDCPTSFTTPLTFACANLTSDKYGRVTCEFYWPGPC